MPLVAMADANNDPSYEADESIARIARKNMEKLAADKERERMKYQKTDADIEAEQQRSKNLILGIAGVGTLASGAFIIPNLTRLAIKVTSGGKDAGYETAGKLARKGRGRGKKEEPEFKEKGTAEKLFNTFFTPNRRDN